jgi:porphobilinogen synthase
MYYPVFRPRRLRRTATLRNMVRETEVNVMDLIFPLFIVEGEGIKKEISSMEGIYQLSIDKLGREARELSDLGIPAVLLFGIPGEKDEVGSGAYSDGGVIQRAIPAIKSASPDLMVITDVCLCEYTSHGHCGIIRDGDVDNDPTLELLAREAVSHARAGADMVAPSDMMDGRVGVIRNALDQEGYHQIPIMSYAAKYASALYGPFREAVESTPEFGDRRTYQMDPSNAREALVEVELDIQEGADIVMVKPALAYLDIVWRIREELDLPVAAYNVSGEYSMVKAAAARGLIDGPKAVVEILTSIKRAGADLILTYFAKEYARMK